MVLALENDSVAAVKKDTSVRVAGFDSVPGDSAVAPSESMMLTRFSSPLMFGTK